jgi:VIT1/CCC1 family predicted Fe2+/Mn2+ transporter
MAVVFGVLNQSAYLRFWPGVWALIVSIVLSTIAVLGILLARFSNSSKQTSMSLMSANVIA